MARLNGPLFSLDARGKLGWALIYSIWMGINYARKYIIPANPSTDAQMLIRGYFTTAVDAYQLEEQTTRNAWDAAIKKPGRIFLSLAGFPDY